MVLFKTDREEREFKEAPEMLKMVADYFILLSLERGKTPTVTRILAPVAGESGVHPDYRGIDFRDQYLNGKNEIAFLYSPQEANEIVAAMNKRFPRKDGKMVCIHHSFTNHKDPNSKPQPFHFHVQIPWEWKQDARRYIKEFTEVTDA